MPWTRRSPTCARRVDVLRFRSIQDADCAARGRRRPQGAAAEARVALTSGRSPRRPIARFLLSRARHARAHRAATTEAASTTCAGRTELDPTDAVACCRSVTCWRSGGTSMVPSPRYRQARRHRRQRRGRRAAGCGHGQGREARLPAEFRAIPAAPAITRGDLAALIAIRLESVVQQAPQRQEVVTDIRGHWAAPWIAHGRRERGVIEAFDNHTFQPRRARASSRSRHGREPDPDPARCAAAGTARTDRRAAGA